MSNYTAAAFRQAEGTGKSGNPASPAFVDDLPRTHIGISQAFPSQFFSGKRRHLKSWELLENEAGSGSAGH